MTSRDETFDPPAPEPPAIEDTVAGNQNAPAQNPVPDPTNNVPPENNSANATGNGPTNQNGPVANLTQPTDYTPYFAQSGGVTESPVLGRRVVDNPLFGPQLMFESNVGDGLGFDESYQRMNARIPYHVVPGHSVLIGDLSASLTNDRGEAYNFGMIWRNYDATRNRVFGWNAYGDVDDGQQNNRWKRFGVGMESLGKYIDFFANGYFVSGTDSVLLNSSLGTDLTLGGNSAFRTRTSTWDNAYSGGDFEVGGPLPLLGRRGINAYAGGYYLNNDQGYETYGYSARVQALITQSATVDVRYTGDDTFGDNLWVSLAYTIPNYRERAILQPKRVRDRLADPVYRNNRVHTSIDVVDTAEAMINTAKGREYNLIYVDPDTTSTTAGGNGAGTLEDPYTSLLIAAMNNNAGIDVINVNPRDDDSNTNLTVPGGLALFDCQVLRSTTEAHTLATIAGNNFIIPAAATGTNLGASIANPTMVAGGSVIRLSNENTVLGMRIDASNTAMTVFGTGITNPLPFTDATILRNTFTNYETAVNLVDGSGTIIFDENTATGLAGASNSGLVLTTTAGTTTELLIRNNTVSDNSVVGISATAGLNATMNADRPTGIGVGGVSVQPTGIVGNTVTNGGEGIVLAGLAGSTINAVVENNTSTGNTNNGFVGRADGSTFNLFSMSGNTFSSNLENGALVHYFNGGTFRAVSEDLDGDGVIDPGEDVNGNGLLDQGIVANSMSNNSIAGLCLFGLDTATGAFDIGGPDASLGNTFAGNTGAGIAADLQDNATAQVDALFNDISGGSADPGLTIVLDFVSSSQGTLIDANGNNVTAFDPTLFGFGAADFDLVANAALQTVQGYYSNLPTVSDNPLSTIPDGFELDLDFVIGDTGSAPSNGATDYYVVTIGETADAPGFGGLAADIGNIRNAQGQGPGQGIFGTPQAVGASAMGVYTNNLSGFGPFNPVDALPTGPLGVSPGLSGETPAYILNALTSGNLTFTRRALGFVTAHELGHTLSLRHIEAAGAVTPNGLAPIMGTPAFDLPGQQLIEPVELALSGNNPGEIPGEAPFTQFNIAQLAGAIGLRVAGSPSVNGVTINATDNARLLASTFNNNTISGAQDNGINIDMQDNAVAEGVTIQSNTITAGSGNGIRLNADGPGAFIDADTTIGGSGSNTYRGNAFLQGNNISMNAGDGFRAIAANGGIIHGNLINNQLTDNGGNGATLSIDSSGEIDFGTPALNRIITGNTITDNAGIGIETVSTVTSTGTGLLNAVIQNNTISNNTGGGIASRMFGPNMFGVTNNVINMTVGGTAAQANTIGGNGNAGVSFSVAGNGLGNFTMSNATVTGTVDGPDLLTNGDGIFLQRFDSSLLTANITNVTATGNAGDGLAVDVQGNDKSDPNQPMSGTVNTVTWNNNNFSTNGGNGARFITRGDAQLIADGENNVLNNNTANGVVVRSSENSTFGDATAGLPPGRRVLLNGTTASNNGQDGFNITAIEDARVLLEITSNRTAATSVGAHAGLNTNGDTNISNNGSDGIHVTTSGGTSDILVTAGTGSTTIDGNGTAGGGNGIRWDASGDSDGIVRVTRTTITNSIAGATEDANGNGILDAGEDGSLTGIQFGNINSDIDVTDGEGIQYNVTGAATATLVVGGIGAGNIIQNNADDGIEIAAQGSFPTISRPVISIVDNTIGGESNGLEAGNGGDGLSLNVIGGVTDASAVGTDPPNIDSSIPPADGDGLDPFTDSVVEDGPIVQLTVTGNTLTNNNRRGANLLITGAAGERDREGAVLIDPLRITMTGNNISSNGEEGVFFQGDTNMNQSRVTFLANFPFPDPPFNPADDRPLSLPFYTPTQPQFLNRNAGTINGNTAFSPTAPDGALGYLNLRTVQNSEFLLTGNQIQNNGVNTITGEGLILRVGTSAYLAATVNNNTFGGNLEEDVRTESFLSFGNTFGSIDNAGDGEFDVIYWDDTAQLDMTFQNNTGNQILLSSDGATYTDADFLKSITLGAFGVTDRNAAFFQVDDGGNLDNPNNTFINFGATQDIDGAFINGGFNLRAAADGAFPNIGFAPFLP